MKTTKISTITAVLLISFFVFSCSEDEVAAPQATKTELLTQEPWLLDRATMTPGITYNGLTFTDATMFIQSCVKDNSYTFKLDNTTSMDEGDLKCDSSAQQVVDAGTWKFNDDETEILFTDNVDLEGMTLKSLSSKELILTRTEALQDTTIESISIPEGDQTISLYFKH